MNPGSVSIPKEESWNGYMIYENGNFTWKDLQGQCFIYKSHNIQKP